MSLVGVGRIWVGADVPLDKVFCLVGGEAGVDVEAIDLAGGEADRVAPSRY